MQSRISILLSLFLGAMVLVPDAIAQSAAADSATTPYAFPWRHSQAPNAGPILTSLVQGIRLPDSTPSDTLKRKRVRAVELSEGYAVRLKIHQIASYLELPVFAAEIIVGQKLYKNQEDGVASSGSLRGTHSALAASLGILFGVNTVTGVWNLAEGWKDPTGRTRRVLHSVLMLVADAGFVATAATAPGHEGFSSGSNSSRSTHRALAISSSMVATAATVMMWLWKG